MREFIIAKARRVARLSEERQVVKKDTPTIRTRLLEVLQVQPSTLALIADTIGVNRQSVAITLGRMQRVGEVQKVGDKKWALR